jgi:hypothetical protein
MLAQRIRTGFHRIGVVIAVLIAVPSVGAMLMSIPVAMGWLPEAWNTRPSEWAGLAGGGAAFLVVAVLGYLAAWTLGWIIAGFAGDSEQE